MEYAPRFPREADPSHLPSGRPWIPMALVGMALVIVAAIWVSALVPDEVTPPTRVTGGRIASAAEIEQLTVLINQANQVHWRGNRTGDISAFPTVFTNDPDVVLHAEWREIISDHWDEIRALLESRGWSDDLIRPGYLSGRAYLSIQTHENGPPYLAGPGKPTVVTEARIDGDRAEVTTRLAEGGGNRTHYLFSRVDNRWLISSVWSSCAPEGCS